MSRALAVLTAAIVYACPVAGAEEPPATTKPEGKAEAPRVFTNEDLTPGEDGASTAAKEAPMRGEARAARAEEKALDRAGAREDRQADHRRKRAAQIQARIDTARADLERLEADSEARNGDIETASDGTKIQGVRPGRGYYLALESAKRRLARAEAELAELEKEPAAPGSRR